MRSVGIRSAARRPTRSSVLLNASPSPPLASKPRDSSISFSSGDSFTNCSALMPRPPRASRIFSACGPPELRAAVILVRDLAMTSMSVPPCCAIYESRWTDSPVIPRRSARSPILANSPRSSLNFPASMPAPATSPPPTTHLLSLPNADSMSEPDLLAFVPASRAWRSRLLKPSTLRFNASSKARSSASSFHVRLLIAYRGVSTLRTLHPSPGVSCVPAP